MHRLRYDNLSCLAVGGTGVPLTVASPVTSGDYVPMKRGHSRLRYGMIGRRPSRVSAVEHAMS